MKTVGRPLTDDRFVLLAVLWVPSSAHAKLIQTTLSSEFVRIIRTHLRHELAHAIYKAAADLFVSSDLWICWLVAQAGWHYNGYTLVIKHSNGK